MRTFTSGYTPPTRRYRKSQNMNNISSDTPPGWKRLDAALFLSQIRERVNSQGFYTPQTQDGIVNDEWVHYEREPNLEFILPNNGIRSEQAHNSLTGQAYNRVSGQGHQCSSNPCDYQRLQSPITICPAPRKQPIPSETRANVEDSVCRLAEIADVDSNPSAEVESVKRNLLPEFQQSGKTTRINGRCIKLHICQVCHKSFTTRTSLKQHNYIHLGLRPYICQFCGKGFTQKVTLRTHIRRHTGEKPYQCGDCRKAFRDLSTYIKHYRVHSGERPYQCIKCNRSFSQSGNLHRHIKTCS